MAAKRSVWRKTLKIGLSITAALVITVLMFVTALWFFPNLILNSNNFDRYAIPLLGNYGVSFQVCGFHDSRRVAQSR